MERDRARVVVVGGGITGCSVAYHLAKAGLDRRRPAREGRADERLDVPRRRARHAVQPLADDDALPPLQRRALRGAGRVRAARQPADRVQQGEPPGAAARRQPGPRDRARCRRRRPQAGPGVDATGQRGVAARRRLGRRGRLRRPAHGDLRPRRRRPRARRRDPHAHAGDRHPPRPEPRGDRRRDDGRADRDGGSS